MYICWSNYSKSWFAHLEVLHVICFYILLIAYCKHKLHIYMLDARRTFSACVEMRVSESMPNAHFDRFFFFYKLCLAAQLISTIHSFGIYTSSFGLIDYANCIYFMQSGRLSMHKND